MGYFPHITRPTKYGNSSNSLIDNIYCIVTNKPYNSGIIFSDICNHLSIFDISNINNHYYYFYLKNILLK